MAIILIFCIGQLNSLFYVKRLLLLLLQSLSVEGTRAEVVFQAIAPTEELDREEI
jgi:hypothetical protein